MIEPRTLVGQADGFQPEEIAYRSLEADRRRMKSGHRGKRSVSDFERDDRNVEWLFIEKRHVDRVSVTPEAEEYQSAFRQFLARMIPIFRRDNHAWPGTLGFNAATFDKNFVE